MADDENVERQHFITLKKCITDNNVDGIKELTNDGVPIYSCSMAATLLEMAIDGQRFEILNILFRKVPTQRFFIMLCYDNKFEQLNLLLQNVAEFKQLISEIYLPLALCSAEFGKCLLDNGANVNVASAVDGCTALHDACEFSRIEIVRLICGQSTIEINKQNFVGQSALHVAVKYNCSLDMIKILLNVTTIDVNLMDVAGQTAFSYACANEAHDIVEYMLYKRRELDLNVDAENQHIFNYILNYPELCPTLKKRKI